MTYFTRRKVNTEKEKDLMTGLIIDTRFCREVLPVVSRELLQVEQFKIVLDWIQEYFQNYDESPREKIEKIYIANRSKLDPAVGDNIESFLRELSKRFEKKESFSTDYYADQSIEYLNERNLRVRTEKIQALLDTGDIKGAEQLFVNYNQVAKTTSRWINPFSEEYVESVLFKEKEYLLQLPGAVGDLIGKLKRKHLFSVLAPTKRGKTWWLLEIAWLAAAVGLRVAFISLEMEEEEMGERSFKRVTSRDFEQSSVILPVFDCLHNQKDNCNLSCRIGNSSGLPLDDLDLPPAYSDHFAHTVCSVCRGKGDGNYAPGIWYKKENRPKINYADLTSTLKSFKAMFGDNLRVMAYAVREANTGTIKRDLDLLEYTEGYVPDVIVIDYADILAPEDNKLEGRDKINETWLMLKNLGQTRNALIATATQSNRGSMDRRKVKATDTGEDIRKLHHANVFISLNQTPREKRKGLMRISIAVARGVDFDELKEVLVVQNLSIGQPFLDSEIPVYLDPNEEGGPEDDEQN